MSSPTSEVKEVKSEHATDSLVDASQHLSNINKQLGELNKKTTRLEGEKNTLANQINNLDASLIKLEHERKRLENERFAALSKITTITQEMVNAVSISSMGASTLAPLSKAGPSVAVTTATATATAVTTLTANNNNNKGTKRSLATSIGVNNASNSVNAVGSNIAGEYKGPKRAKPKSDEMRTKFQQLLKDPQHFLNLVKKQYPSHSFHHIQKMKPKDFMPIFKNEYPDFKSDNMMADSLIISKRYFPELHTWIDVHLPRLYNQQASLAMPPLESAVTPTTSATPATVDLTTSTLTQTSTSTSTLPTLASLFSSSLLSSSSSSSLASSSSPLIASRA